MIGAALAILCGIALFHQLPALPHSSFTIIPLALMLAAIRWRRLRLAALIALGFSWAWFNIGEPLLHPLPEELSGEVATISGRIASIPNRNYRRSRFEFDIDEVSFQDTPHSWKGKILLSWYSAPDNLVAGERWQFAARLKPAHGFANTGGFDYEGWLYQKGIGATATVQSAAEPVKLAAASGYVVTRWRQSIARRIQESGVPPRAAALLLALAVGERSELSPDQWQLMERTGTSHLMAISGLHIGLVAAIAFWIGRFAWLRSTPLVHWMPGMKIGALAGLIMACVYALLAGFSVPTQRALIMLSVLMSALWMERVPRPSRTLAIALLAVLTWDPSSPLGAGFWLSFGAVAVILFMVSGRRGASHSMMAWTRLQLGVSIALAPAGLLFFQQVSLGAPLANLIAIPWMSATVVPLTLLGVFVGEISESLQNHIWQVAAVCADWIWAWLGWISDQSWSQFRFRSPPVWTWLFAAPGIALLLAPAGFPGRTLGAVMMLPIAFSNAPGPAPGEIWLTQFDAGGGLSVVVRTADHILVYDTGPRLGTRLDAASAALLPWLYANGIHRIDTLILSHADARHTGGTRSLLQSISAKQVLTPDPVNVPVGGARVCRAGQSWHWDEVRFAILNPISQNTGKDNDSCVLEVKGAYGTALLTGDIGPSVQRSLVQSGKVSSINILFAPAQGEKPPDADFLSEISPRLILLSTNFGDRYGHPKPEVIEAYTRTEARLLNSADSGAIDIKLNRDGESVRLQREQRRRYWHHGAAARHEPIKYDSATIKDTPNAGS